MNEKNSLQGNRVRLTALKKKDVSTIVQWHEDIGFLRLLDSNAAVPKSEDEIVSWIDECAKDHTIINLGIRLLEREMLVGTIGIFNIEWSNKVGDIVIGIGDRQNWGKGYGTEALDLIIYYAFNELNFHRLGINVLSYNERAIALYERTGFQREGVMREFGMRDGKRYDLIFYGMLRNEWPNSAFQRDEVG